MRRYSFNPVIPAAHSTTMPKRDLIHLIQQSEGISTHSTTMPKRDTEIECILLDIEGTTTPVDFVYRVLFPYARAHVAEFLVKNQSSRGVRGDILGLMEQQHRDELEGLYHPAVQPERMEHSVDSAVSYVHWLMDSDRKVTALKSLQGRIWEAGYRGGEFQGQVFDDVPPSFERWSANRRRIFIYSSGSVLAQKLLFGYSTAGDLTGFISGYFDTEVGPKKSIESYKRIAAQMSVDTRGQDKQEKGPSPPVLFISDTVGELDAARAAGMRTLLSLRPGNQHVADPNGHQPIRSLDEVH